MLKKALYFGLGGLAEVKEKVEKELKILEEKGKISKDDSKNFIDNLCEKGEEERKKHHDTLKNTLSDILRDLGVATKEDIARLEKKIDDKKL